MVTSRISTPPVSIGLPVYNGELYLKETIDSLLAQTYTDFELLIVDNGSDDGTEEICRYYCRLDSRISYFRSQINHGAAWSFNEAFSRANGAYFKWAADDDVYHERFLAECVRILDQNDDVVLCFTRTEFIDGEGKLLREYDYPLNLTTCTERDLFRLMACAGHIVHEIFGLIRADALHKSPLIGGYVGSDLILLGDLVLKGRFYQVPEVLFFHREHVARSTSLMTSAAAYTEWFDTSKRNEFVYPRWRRLFENLKTVFRNSQLKTSRWKLISDLIRVANWQRKELLEEASQRWVR